MGYGQRDDDFYYVQQPPFSMNRFTGMLMVGYSWGQMMMLAVPPDEFWGINLRYLNHLIPLFAALGEFLNIIGI